MVRTAAGHYRAWTREIASTAAAAVVAALSELATVLLIAQLASLVVDDATDASISLLGTTWTVELEVLVAVGLALVVVRFAADQLANLLQARLVARYDAAQRLRVVEAMATSTWTAQAGTRGGEVVDLLTTYLNQTRVAMKAFSDGCVSIVSFALMMTAGILAGGVVALGVGALLGGIVLALRPLTAWARRCGAALADASPVFATRITETVDLSRELKAFGVTDAGVERVRGSISEVEGAWRRFYYSQAVAPSVLLTATLLLVIGGLGLVIDAEATDPEQSIAMVLLLYRAAQYGRSLQSSYQVLSTTAPFIDRLDAEVAAHTAAREDLGGEPVGEIGRVALLDVGFAYGDAAPVLTGVTMHVARGEVVGLVGASGAGKTTIANLLLRLTRPTGGHIELDGRPMDGVSLASWRAQVALVPQEGVLLDDTVRTNVRFLRPAIDDHAVVDALRSARVLDEIEAMPDGLEHQVGERGRLLSGGQRQRICIARALAGHPQLLVFDEPTSALDARSEEAFRLAVQAVRSEAAVVIIAHRSETLQVCDRILRVADGVVAEVTEASPTDLG